MGNSKDLYEKFKAVSDIEKQTCKNEANIKKVRRNQKWKQFQQKRAIEEGKSCILSDSIHLKLCNFYYALHAT